MRKILMIMAACAMMMACQSTQENAQQGKPQIISAETGDSTLYSNTYVRMSWIDGKDSVSQLINDTLWATLAREVEAVNECVDAQKPLNIDSDVEPQSENMVIAYGRWLSRQMNAEGMNLHRLRQETEAEMKAERDTVGADAITDDATDAVDNTNGEGDVKSEIKGGEEESQPIQLEWSVVIDTLSVPDGARYVVFNANVQTYLGGAHGSVGGEGILVFDLETGRRFTSFFKPGAEVKMRPLIKEGLASYFHEMDEEISASDVDNYLSMTGAEYPLPQCTPYPTAEGLMLCYGQYEVAPYAAGMPSFVISYEKLMPYLTDEAITLLGLDTPEKK